MTAFFKEIELFRGNGNENEKGQTLEEFLEELPSLTGAYPEETRITAPIETWSDDFSIAIAGIPSMVNDFTGGSFMETNYHSQFDNDGFYDEDVYRMHHELFGLLLMAIDRTVVVPLDFSRVFRKARERLDSEWCEKTGADGQRLLRVLEQATATAQQLYAKVEKTNRNARHADASAAGVENASGLCVAETGDAGAVNGDFITCVQGTNTAAEVPAADTRKLERSLLQVFQQEQDAYVRIDWYGNVLFPHGILQDRLQLLEGAVRNLKEGSRRHCASCMRSTATGTHFCLKKRFIDILHRMHWIRAQIG